MTRQQKGGALSAPPRRVYITKFLLRTVAAAFAAYAITYLPFVVKQLSMMVQTQISVWEAFGKSAEDAFAGGLAASATACLTYFESDKEIDFGNNCGMMAFCSFVSVFVSLVAWLICRTATNSVEARLGAGGLLSWIAVGVIVWSIFFAFATVIQIRRARDQYS